MDPVTGRTLRPLMEERQGSNFCYFIKVRITFSLSILKSSGNNRYFVILPSIKNVEPLLYNLRKLVLSEERFLLLIPYLKELVQVIFEGCL